MSADKYPSIFSRQMKAIVYLYFSLLLCGSISIGEGLLVPLRDDSRFIGAGPSDSVW